MATNGRKSDAERSTAQPARRPNWKKNIQSKEDHSSAIWSMTVALKFFDEAATEDESEAARLSAKMETLLFKENIYSDAETTKAGDCLKARSEARKLSNVNFSTVNKLIFYRIDRKSVV